MTANSSLPSGSPVREGRDFIRTIVDRHQAEGRYPGVVTRFPPEPNGYLHVGHAKSICLNFGLAEEYGGRCHLRFDDTNPLTEDEEYTRAIQRDVEWLGFEWGEHLYFASDYFSRMYQVAEGLVRKGKAYVDSASEEEIREARGTVTEPGRPTPHRNRSVEENLDLFRRMKAGEFPDGSHVLRGKIDLASPNMLMRDPVFYRIRHARHYRTGDAWCIYPLYDFAHCLEDAFEGVSHSLCTLEFENNRELYDWILSEGEFPEPHPRQYEFSRLNLEYTVLSKRKLIRLVQEGHVSGWDDPRMPTVAGLRRRGVPPAAIRRFCDMIGVTRTDSRVDVGKLEFSIRDELNRSAPRYMAVLRPLSVVLTNWAEGPDGGEETEGEPGTGPLGITLEAPLFPDEGVEAGTRQVPLEPRIFIDVDDFSMEPPKGWKRLSPNGVVRLRHGYVVRCHRVEVDPITGAPVELHCTVDWTSQGGSGAGWKPSGAIQWVPHDASVAVEVRLYDRLFQVPDPDDVPEEGDFIHHLNPDSLFVEAGARVEPALARLLAEEAGSTDGLDRRDSGSLVRVQLERVGYFAPDSDSRPDALVLNRVVGLRDGWAKARKGEEPETAGAATRDEASPGASTRSGEAPEERAPATHPQRDGVREAHPELKARFHRYQEKWGLSLEDADFLTGSRALSDFFEEAMAAYADPSAVAAWTVNDLQRELREQGRDVPEFPGGALGRLAQWVEEGLIPRTTAREFLTVMVTHGTHPDRLLEDRGGGMVDGEALQAAVDSVVAANPVEVKAFREGKAALVGFFMGRVMGATQGKANPEEARERLLRALATTSETSS
ncbi:MAG: glutamine--tRNA ligase/YqeY domain fusion protein [Gemmatimonadota bacterium]